MRRHEGILRGFFRLRRRPEHGHRGPEHGAPVLVDQLAESAFVPVPRPRDQLVIAHTAL